MDCRGHRGWNIYKKYWVRFSRLKIRATLKLFNTALAELLDTHKVVCFKFQTAEQAPVLPFLSILPLLSLHVWKSVVWGALDSKPQLSQILPGLNVFYPTVFNFEFSLLEGAYSGPRGLRQNLLFQVCWSKHT